MKEINIFITTGLPHCSTKSLKVCKEKPEVRALQVAVYCRIQFAIRSVCLSFCGPPAVKIFKLLQAVNDNFWQTQYTYSGKVKVHSSYTETLLNQCSEDI